jgi:hypothetical protein
MEPTDPNLDLDPQHWFRPFNRKEQAYYLHLIWWAKVWALKTSAIRGEDWSKKANFSNFSLCERGANITDDILNYRQSTTLVPPFDRKEQAYILHLI